MSNDQKNNAMNTVVKVNQLSILDHNRSLLNDVNLTLKGISLHYR